MNLPPPFRRFSLSAHPGRLRRCSRNPLHPTAIVVHVVATDARLLRAFHFVYLLVRARHRLGIDHKGKNGVKNGVRFTYPFEALPALGSNKANPLEMEWLAV